MRMCLFRHVAFAAAFGACLKAQAARPPWPTPRASEACAGREDCGTLRARVRAAGQRTALAQVRVVLVSASGATTVVETDAAGRLAVSLPPGEVRVVIAAPGFERFEQTLEVRARQTTERQLFPRPTAWNPYRTVVRDPAERRPEAGARPLSREEIATMPGSQGDPLRGLQKCQGWRARRAGWGSWCCAGRARCSRGCSWASTRCRGRSTRWRWRAWCRAM